MFQKPFQGLSTFLKAPVGDTTRAIGVVGIPFDGATSYNPGARFGPESIRAASKMLTDGDHPLFDVDPATVLTDLGDIDVSNTDIEKSLDEITAWIGGSGYVGDPEKRLLCMGGDHTVTTGILRALAPHHENLHLLHIDAHCDTWEDHFGDPLGHGTWVRNVIDEGLIAPENVVQVGIRSPANRAIREWLTDQGGTVVSTREALRNGIGAALSTLLEDCPVYVSFDIDALDPAHAPGTGTPEIGGLTTAFALDLLEGLRRHIVVGMDLVEVNPLIDVPSKITSLAGATLLWTMAAMMAVDLQKNADTPGGRN